MEEVSLEFKQHRKFLRLFAHIPIQFAIANDPRIIRKATKTRKKEISKKELFFRQASTLNISSGGMSILIAGASEAFRKELKKENLKIYLKVSIPNVHEPVEFEGEVTRFYTLKEGRSHQDIVGVKFDESDQENKATWIAFVNENRRRKRNKKLMLASLVLSVVTALVALQTKLNLVKTTADKVLLEKQIASLENQRKKLNSNISGKLQKIKAQEVKLKASEQLIELNQKEIETNQEENEKLKQKSKELNEATQKARKFLNLLEVKMYTYLVKESNGSIELSNKPDLKLFQSKTYKLLYKAKRKRKNKLVGKLAKKCVKQFPLSPWARVVYSRYLYQNKKRDLAKKQFKKYLELFLK